MSIHNVDFCVLVESGPAEEWRVSCDIHGRTNAAPVEFNEARCGHRVLNDRDQFLAYCERHGTSVDLHAFAHDALVSRYADQEAFK